MDIKLVDVAKWHLKQASGGALRGRKTSPSKESNTLTRRVGGLGPLWAPLSAWVPFRLADWVQHADPMDLRK